MPRCILGYALFLALICSLSTSAAEKKDSYAHEAHEKSFAKYVEIPGAERIGSDQCRTCHEEQAKTFRFSNHA
jgi:hypothetical protein